MLVGVETADHVARTVAHIAATLAGQGFGEILLVDADLTHKTLSQQFERSRAAGLAEILSRGEPWQRHVQSTSRPQLHLLPAGQDRVARVATLAPQLAAVVNEMKQFYSFVLTDGGAATELVAQTFGRYHDATYLLVPLARAGEDQVHRAVSKLRATGHRLLGCIAAA
jgi:Mrp family chromosome partitioning ATPase